MKRATDYKPVENFPDLLRCTRCGEVLSKRTSVRKHQARLPCIAAANERRVEREDLISVIETGFVHELCKIVGVDTEKLMVRYRKPAWGRDARKSSHVYAPGWIARLFVEHADLGDYAANLSRMAPVLKRAITDMTYRKQLEASVMLGGTRALAEFGVEEAKARWLFPAEVG